VEKEYGGTPLRKEIGVEKGYGSSLTKTSLDDKLSTPHSQRKRGRPRKEITVEKEHGSPLTKTSLDDKLSSPDNFES